MKLDVKRDQGFIYTLITHILDMSKPYQYLYYLADYGLETLVIQNISICTKEITIGNIPDLISKMLESQSVLSPSLGAFRILITSGKDSDPYEIVNPKYTDVVEYITDPMRLYVLLDRKNIEVVGLDRKPCKYSSFLEFAEILQGKKRMVFKDNNKYIIYEDIEYCTPFS